MDGYLLGIDFGTGGAKAAIADAQGQVLGYAFAEYPAVIPHAGWSEHDAGQYWLIACRIIREAIGQARITPGEVKGIAASSALPSMVMIDAAGEPVNNAYNLMDRRAVEQVQWLKDHVGEQRVFEISKNRLDDHPSLVNLMWEKQNRPGGFARVHKALTIDGYITYKLTGRAMCHYSGAAFYGVAYNLLKREFDSGLLERIGICPELLPELCRCEEIVGQVTAKAAGEAGLAAGTPVAGGQVDCNASWMGAGALDDGDIQMNLGTCGNFGIIHTDATFHQSMIAFNYTTDAPDRPVYITVPTTTTGGGLIRYLRDRFYMAEMEAEKNGGVDAYEVINREAQQVPAGSEGLVVLPYLMGERTPIWDPQARGAVFGLSLNHGRGHLARAMMESVAYALYDSFRIVAQSGRRINAPIVLNEGGAKSTLWRRIITDVFNVPTVITRRRTGAPFGDAILAGVACGMYPDFSVARQFADTADRMEPDPAAHERYMAYFELYKRLYGHVKDDYRALARCRELTVLD